jgi:hypothetical protein
MAYRVSLAAPAEMDAYAAFERIREAAPCMQKSGSQPYSRPFSVWKRFPRVVRSFPRRKSLAILPGTCFTAKEKLFTESSFISATTSTMCGFCACGILPAMPLQPPTWRANKARWKPWAGEAGSITTGRQRRTLAHRLHQEECNRSVWSDASRTRLQTRLRRRLRQYRGRHARHER